MKNKNNKKSKRNKTNSKKHSSNNKEFRTIFKNKKYMFTFVFVILILILTSIFLRDKLPFGKDNDVLNALVDDSIKDSNYALDDTNKEFITKMALLENEIFLNNDILEMQSFSPHKIGSKPMYVVFLSLSDSKNKAEVIKGSGETLKKAWTSSISNAQAFIIENDYDPIWVKVDIVNNVKKLDVEKFENALEAYNTNYYRKGISLDHLFNIALLESEINSNKIIDYDDDKINKKRLNNYLVKYKNTNVVDKIPKIVYEFTTISYFSDQNNIVYELYTDELNYGRRKIENLDKLSVENILINSGQFLMDNLKEEGKFVYGYFPTFDKEIENYNILRHTGTIWSLVIQYKITGDNNIIPKVDSAIKYLVDNSVVYKDENTAYILERKSNEIKLGGNGIAIVMLTSYMEEFNTDIYRDLVIKLGNGILELQDETGKYHHILNYPDFTKGEENRTVYYDGEATFALAKLYGLTKDPKWLAAASLAADYFIENDYTKYRDHWVSYSINEITKYSPEEKYFEFGLKNAQMNMDKIYKGKTTNHIELELLMASYELYERIAANNIQVDYLKNFNKDELVKTINHRASYMLNAYFYPEYAMYFKNPERILNSFYIRHDSFRIRIDDIQHFIGGYYNYYKYYDSLSN